VPATCRRWGGGENRFGSPVLPSAQRRTRKCRSALVDCVGLVSLWALFQCALTEAGIGKIWRRRGLNASEVAAARSTVMENNGFASGQP
jgi:hypothetical protein